MGSEARVQRERLCVHEGKLLSIVRALESIRNQSYSNQPRSGLAAVWFIDSSDFQLCVLVATLLC